MNYPLLHGTDNIENVYLWLGELVMDTIGEKSF